MRFADWPGCHVLHWISAAKFPRRVLRRCSKRWANGSRARYARNRAPEHAHRNPPHQRRWNPYADEWASVLDGRGAGEQSCPRRRQHRLFPAKEISDGHADFRAYFPREREIHRHRDGRKRSWPEICLSVPVCGGSTSWQKPGALRDDTGGLDCWGLGFLALRREADEARCPKKPGVKHSDTVNVSARPDGICGKQSSVRSSESSSPLGGRRERSTWRGALC